MMPTLLRHGITTTGLENSCLALEIVGNTDPGRIREHNEDAIAIDETLGIAILADGMGGYQAGEVASELAVKTIMAELTQSLPGKLGEKRPTRNRFHATTILLEQAVLQANQVIYELAQKQVQYHGMGTTLVVVLFHDKFISVAHVGDSRFYRLRGNELRQLTKDHSINQELVDCGLYTPEQARHAPNKNLVTRALGVGATVTVDLKEYYLKPKDIYLICSDGLTDMLDDREILAILKNKKEPLPMLSQSLINLANDKGGKDNISLILARHYPLLSNPNAETTWLKRLLWRYN
jgi:protein phosphatase